MLQIELFWVAAGFVRGTATLDCSVCGMSHHVPIGPMICSTLLTRIENSHEEAKMNGEGNSSNATARFSWEQIGRPYGQVNMIGQH